MINNSELPCAIERRSGVERVLRLGLRSIKHLSQKATDRLLAARVLHGRFRSLEELLQAVPLSKREITALILCGACDDLAPLSPEMYPFQHEAVLRDIASGVPLSLSASAAEQRAPSAMPEEVRLFQSLVRVRNELGFLDMHVTHHPMQLLRAEAERFGCLPTAVVGSGVGQVTRIAGLIAATRRVVTRRGQPMQFITFEDEYELIEAVIFPGRYTHLRKHLDTPGPFLVTGLVREEDGDIHLAVSRLIPFHLRHTARAGRVAALTQRPVLARVSTRRHHPACQ